jgi:drug/metabolite transporter (DMT)-like permease
MGALLAFGAALVWGTGDFFGGMASRRGPVLSAAFFSQVVGLATAILLVPLFGGDPTGRDLLWGLVGGLFAGSGLLSFYQGMAVSRIAVVAPVAAIGTAVFPAVVGLVGGDRLSALEYGGAVCAVVAIWLLTRVAEDEHRGSLVAGAVYGTVTGVGFGGLLVALAQIPEAAGFWPLVPTRVAGALLLGVVAAALRHRPALPHVMRSPVLAAGVLGMVGNGTFILAAQRGSLTLVSVVASLFPAATVVLARVVFDEPLTAARVAGLGLGLAGVGLITAG